MYSPISTSPTSSRASIAAKSDDVSSDIVGQLGAIRPSQRSRKSRVADFLFRRNKPALSAEALSTANRAHSARFFAAALAQLATGTPCDTDAMADLMIAVRKGKGAPSASFDPARTFATQSPEKVALLLGRGGAQFRQDLQVKLVESGVGGSKAKKCAEVIYAALVAQFATNSETARLGAYHEKINAIETSGQNLQGQIVALRSVESDLAREDQLSGAGIAQVKARLAALRPLLEQSATLYEGLINATTRDITTDSSPEVIESRLGELDQHSEAIGASANLSDETRQHLNALMETSRTFLTILKTRTVDLDALAGQSRLQGALGGLGASEFVKAQLGLTHIKDNIAPSRTPALLARLDEWITGIADTGLIAAMQAGDAGIIDMVLHGPDWDKDAWRLKSCQLDPDASLPMVNASVQHELRIATRELDKAMQSESLKASVLKKMGIKGKHAHDQLPVNAFQALKANAVLISWLTQNAPAIVGERDLAIADWIRLSLHDPAADQAKAKKECDELFRQLGAKGINTEDMQAYARQGFKSTGDVHACARQLQAFSQALQGNTLAASVDPQVRAAQTGMQLLRGIGIEASHINDPAIDAQIARLLENASGQPGGVDHLLDTLRRVAVLQIATQSNDPKFTPSGKNAAGSYGDQIMKRLAGMGIAQDAPNLDVSKAAAHALQKWPRDSRDLKQLCADFDPASKSNRARALYRSAVSGKPAIRTAAADAAAVRRGAIEATLRGAVAGLQPNEAITISFGASGDFSVSAPVIPGLSVKAEMNAGKNRSIRVSREDGDVFAVETLSGTTVRQGASVALIADVLDVSVGVTQGRAKGQLAEFNSQAACEAFVVDLATGRDMTAALKAAHSVQAASHKERSGDLSVTATADFTIASLSAQFSASAGERSSVHQNKQFKHEVFSRSVRAEVVLKAALAGDLASAQTGVGMDLGVRRAVTWENGIFAGRPTHSGQADLTPTLSVVARVVSGNTQSCLDILLPGTTEEQKLQKQSLAAQLGTLEDGTELFARYRLTNTALDKANGLLGQADAALTDAARHTPGSAQDDALNAARDLVNQAHAMSRDPANYLSEGFGWTLGSETSVERTRGAVTQYASRSAQQSGFVSFNGATANTPGVGQSLLLAVMR